jgi:hypothetical protein
VQPLQIGVYHATRYAKGKRRAGRFWGSCSPPCDDRRFTLRHYRETKPVAVDGGVGGALCVVTEDTERTIGERRLRTLRELAARTYEVARSVDEACQNAAPTLAGHRHDLSFVLLYLVEDDGRCAATQWLRHRSSYP